MFRRIPKLFGGFFAVAALILTTGLFSTWQLESLHGHLDAVGESHMPTLDLIRQFDNATDHYRRTQLQHVVAADGASKDDLEGEIDELSETANDLLARVTAISTGEDRDTAVEINAEWAEYRDESELFIVPSRALDTAAAVAILNGTAREAFTEMSAALDVWGSTNALAARNAVNVGQSSFQLAVPLVFGLTLFAVVLAIVLGVAVTTAVRREVRGAATAAGKIAQDERTAAMINQFTDMTALTDDDVSVSEATLATLDELLHPDAATLHVSNRSQDRALPQASLGTATAEILALGELARCPALRRSSLYVTPDAATRLTYHCPVYPVTSGTLVCVPLIALGETTGAAHLHWSNGHDVPLAMRTAITRIAEHAALSIGNRRLLLALRGQATTDARTGLANSRAFDEAVEEQLADRDGRQPHAMLMLDLDHFKDFNDRHGHPAGDEALRVFADILRSCIRDEDLAARYGGEEFVVSLRGLSAAAAGEVAERIRERTESTIIPLAPGLTAHLTVSIGIAIAPEDGSRRNALLKRADEALYRAKQEGRNRVVQASSLTGRASAAPELKPLPAADA